MFLPAVRKDTRLDYLLDEYRRLVSTGLGTNLGPPKKLRSTYSVCTIGLHLSSTFHEAVGTPADLSFDYEF